MDMGLRHVPITSFSRQCTIDPHSTRSEIADDCNLAFEPQVGNRLSPAARLSPLKLLCLIVTCGSQDRAQTFRQETYYAASRGNCSFASRA